MVRQYHAPILRTLVRQKLIVVRGCYDLDQDRAAAMARALGARTVGTTPDADAADRADIVLIATPPESHASLARRYAERGRAILIEKPFSARFSEASELVQLAAQHRAPLLVAHMRRFYPSVQIARDLVCSGGLGAIRAVEAYEGGRWDWPASSDYFLRNPFGGVLYDTGSHLLDTVLFVLGGEQDSEFAVEAVTRDPRAEPSHRLEAHLRLGSVNDSPVTVSLAVSRTEPLANVIKFHSENGVLLLPTAFDFAATRVQGRSHVELDTPRPADAAANVPACFLKEHLELLAAARGGRASSLLAADQFLFLTKLLETLDSAR